MAPRRSTAALATRFLPQLATLVKTAPEGDGWLHEIKFDGYRIAARVDGGRVRLLSRRGNDWSARFPEVCQAVAALPVRRALLDGEVAAVLPDGRTSFQALQNAGGGSARPVLRYFVFDVLHLDGEDVAKKPLDERKALLRKLLAASASTTLVTFSDHVVGGGARFLAAACARGLEGIVSKRRDRPYEPGRHGGWVKTKCWLRQEVVIGGFTEPAGARAGLGAVLVGVYDEGGRLAFAGKVGTGFSQRMARELRAKLDRLERPTAPFADPPRAWRRWRTHWVRPELVGEVAFSEWTNEGRMRHPSFQGMREDKSPHEVIRERPVPVARVGHDRRRGDKSLHEVIRERPVPVARVGKDRRRGDEPPHEVIRERPVPVAMVGGDRRGGDEPPGAGIRTRRPSDAHTVGYERPPRSRERPLVDRPLAERRAAAGPDERVTVAGVGLSHPRRVLYPGDGITKLDVARYYADVADAIVRHVAGRPLTLVRCPDGLGSCFYMKHTRTWHPPDVIRQVRIREQKKIGEYAVVDSIAGVVALAQMNVLEIHTWNATVDRLEQPDRVVIDLDPGPEVAWKDVVAGARVVRTAFEALGLASFVKTTGGKGLHVVVPLVPRHDWDTCLRFARGVAEAIVRQDPRRYTTAVPKRGRERKILLDYLRNTRGGTSVAAFSTRARPGCPLSMPVAWDELGPGLKPDAFRLGNVRRRLRSFRRDPWRDYWTMRQHLGVAALRAVGVRS